MKVYTKIHVEFESHSEAALFLAAYITPRCTKYDAVHAAVDHLLDPQSNAEERTAAARKAVQYLTELFPIEE